MDYQNILFHTDSNIARVTINRPDKLNALNDRTLDELADVFKQIKNNDSIFVVIITGSGEKAFVAGADISELNKLNSETGKLFSQKGQTVFNSIENLGKPVIAAVNGFALGGGCELAMACHIRIASSKAKFGQPEVNLGIIPGYGGTQRLPRLINTGLAMEYILTGDMINADEAFRIGLVNHVYEPDDLMNKCLELANKIISKGQIAVQFCVRSVTAVKNTHISNGLDFESDAFAETCGTDDFKEGASAFLEKRRPEFKNKI